MAIKLNSFLFVFHVFFYTLELIYHRRYDILTANLIRGRVSGEGVKDILLDTNQSLKVVQCDEDGEVLRDGTPLKVVLVDGDSDQNTFIGTKLANSYQNVVDSGTGNLFYGGNYTPE